MSDVTTKAVRSHALKKMRTPLNRAPWLLPGFAIVWGFIVIAPLLVLFAYSFFESRNFSMIYQPSLQTWTELFSSGRFVVTVRTLRIALTVTLIELAIGFPFALWLAKGGCSKVTRAVVLAMVTMYC